MTGNDLRAWRAAHHYSQSQLARRLEIHVMTISKWERDLVPITRVTELALAGIAADDAATKEEKTA